jgi:hypothetical protein
VFWDSYFRAGVWRFLHTYRCAVCSVRWQSAACRVHFAECSVQCAVCSMQCAVCSMQYAVCSVRCLMSGVQSVEYSVLAVCSVRCAACSVLRVACFVVDGWPRAQCNRGKQRRRFTATPGTERSCTAPFPIRQSAPPR